MEIQRRLQLRPSIAANAALQPFVHLQILEVVHVIEQVSLNLAIETYYISEIRVWLIVLQHAA